MFKQSANCVGQTYYLIFVRPESWTQTSEKIQYMYFDICMWIDELSKAFFPLSSMYYHQLSWISDSVIFIGISVFKYTYKNFKKEKLLKTPIKQHIFLP